MKYKCCYKKIISLFLSVSITLSLSLPALAASASGTLTTVQTVGEQTQYTRETDWTSNGKINQSAYLTYSPNASVSPVVLYGNKLYGRSTMSEIASFAENGGLNIIGGINADFFTLATGLPSGIVINNGKLVSSDGWQYGIGFNADGSAFIGKPLLKIKAVSDSHSITITSINKLRTDAGVYMLTDDFSSNTQISSDGLNVILTPDESSYLKVGQTIHATVESVERQSKSTAIPSGKIILTASSAVESMLSGLTAGEKLAISITPDDARWDNAVYAVGGGALLVQNGAAVAQTDTSVNPRSAVGIKADGSIVLFTVDGRKAGYSNGMAFSQLSQKLISLGCVTALNLDGGGSTTFGLKSPGYFPVSLINKPSDGSQRRCANFIFLATRGTGDGQAQRLHLYPEKQLAMRGAEISFSAKATDSAWTPVEIDGVPSLSADSSLGKITDGNTLIVSDSAAGGKVYGELYGMKDSVDIGIADDIDWFGITSDGTHEITQINLNDGEQLDLKVSAYYKSRPVAVSDKIFIWSISNSAAGSIDSGGVITAGSSGTFATVTASYGSLKKTVQLTVGKTPILVTDFEDENLFDGQIIYKDDTDTDDTVPDNSESKDSESVLPDGAGTNETSSESDNVPENSSDNISENSGSSAVIDGLAPSDADNQTGETAAPDSNPLSDDLPPETAGNLSVSSEKDFSYVKYGYASAAVEYNLSESTDKIRLIPKFSTNLGSAPSLSLWVYGDNSGNTLTVSGKSGAGTETSKEKYDLNFSGWKRLIFTFDSKISAVSSVDLLINQTSAHSGKIYFDNMRALYGSTAEDDSAPVISISSPAANSEFPAGSAIAVRGTVTDGNAPYIPPHDIQVLIDGVSFPFEYNRESGSLFASVDTISLSGGLHKLTVTAEDSAGNLSRISEKFTLTPSAASPFIDISAHWSKNYVEFLSSKNIITGVNTTAGVKFNPERMTARAEMAVIMARYMNYDLTKYETAPLDFSDMDKIPAWALPYIKAVYSEQLMLGKALPDGTSKFDPNAQLTRAEAMTLLGRTIRQGYTVKDAAFSDSAAIPAWSSRYISTLNSLSVVNGYSADNSIRPLNGIKRGEIASIFCNLY